MKAATRRWRDRDAWLAAGLLGAFLSTAKAGAPPAAKAWTQGDFTVRYELVRERNDFLARNVRVDVRNRTHYVAPPSPPLVHHEDVHRRINRLGARDVQSRLAGYRAAGATPDQADRAFRAEFRRRLREVEDLHRAWDATHRVPSTGLAERAETFYP